MKTAFTFLLAGLALSSVATAQSFPENRPITLVVPFAAGGGTDAIARDFGKQLGDLVGQTVIIENRGGGGGAIGAQMVSRAKPDGHTLLIATSTFVSSASTGQQQPYDVINDFTPVAWLGHGPMVIVVNRDTGITSVPQLIAQSKAKPDSLNFVSSGLGSVTHLAGELFLQRTGVKMTHVPYKGSGPALVDLLSGQGQVFFATVPTILGQIKGGRVTLIATTSKARTPLFPDAPTVMEAGVKDYNVGTWWGILAPPGMPQPVLTALNKAVNQAAASDALKHRFAEEGAEAFQGSPADFATVLKEELETWRRVVKDGNLKFQ